jgi:hypothetical protein
MHIKYIGRVLPKGIVITLISTIIIEIYLEYNNHDAVLLLLRSRWLMWSCFAEFGRATDVLLYLRLHQEEDLIAQNYEQIRGIRALLSHLSIYYKCCKSCNLIQGLSNQ